MPACTVAVDGAAETAMAWTVTVARADLLESVTEVAASVTCRSVAGGDAGAVYVTSTPLAVVAGDTVPHGTAAHDTLQATPLLAGSFVTEALKVTLVPAGTEAAADESETVIGGPEAEEPPPQPEFETLVAVIAINASQKEICRVTRRTGTSEAITTKAKRWLR